MPTVLVVDDEPKIVQLARDYLEHAGFAVLTAGDGPSALQAARVRQPDLIVLDLGPARLDGLEVMRSIRAAGSTPDHRAHGPRQRARQAARARARRRRLRHQAVQPARARGSRPGGAAPERARGRGRASASRSATSSLDVPRMRTDGRRPRRRADRRPSSSSSPRWPASRAASSPARSCSTPSTASRSSATSARSTRT